MLRNLAICMIVFIAATLLPGCVQQGAHRTEVLILHMGSHATPNIARRLEKHGVSYTILQGFVPAEEIRQINPKALIITGSPDSVLNKNSPRAPEAYYSLNIPILGLCYGHQMIVEQLGGKVGKCRASEKGIFPVTFTGKCGLTPKGMAGMNVLMDHDDCVTEVPEGFHTDASSDITQHAMVCSHARKLYLIQFHPERYDTVPESGVILDAFIMKVFDK